MENAWRPEYSLAARRKSATTMAWKTTKARMNPRGSPWLADPTWVAIASTVNIAANAPKRLNAPTSGKLVAYQAYSIQDHQTGMKSAANSTIPSIVGSSCTVCATAPTATTKQRSKKSSSHEARRSGSVTASGGDAKVVMLFAVNVVPGLSAN